MQKHQNTLPKIITQSPAGDCDEKKRDSAAYKQENYFFTQVKQKMSSWYLHRIPAIGSRKSECNTEKYPTLFKKRSYTMYI